MSIAKFDPTRLPEPDEMGFFMHPDVPGEDESDDIATMIRDAGFEFSLVDFYYDGDVADVHAWRFSHDGLTDEDMKSCMDRWNPIPPDGEGWIIVSKHDTEDGPQALFVRPAQPPKGEEQK